VFEIENHLHLRIFIIWEYFSFENKNHSHLTMVTLI